MSTSMLEFGNDPKVCDVVPGTSLSSPIEPIFARDAQAEFDYARIVCLKSGQVKCKAKSQSAP